MTDWADTRRDASPERATQLGALLGNAGTSPPIRRLLEESLGVTDTDTQLIGRRRIKEGVHRLTFTRGHTTRSVIIKRLAPDAAYRNQVLITRWLPAVGLEENGPILLGSIAEMDGRRVWHAYEDLGELSLDSPSIELRSVEESVRVIARLHGRFAEHALLGEGRLWGGDLGVAYYHANAVDAIRALRAVEPGRLESQHRAALNSLIEALRRMLENEHHIALLLTEHGGPETLLHGDLWRQNILLCRDGEGVLQPRLIDWDHVGVGQVGYDLSTLLSRFPLIRRPEVLEMYRRELSAHGWQPPNNTILNQIFDVAERTRIANRVIWPAIEIRFGNHVEWALDHLIELSEWFDRIEPVLS